MLDRKWLRFLVLVALLTAWSSASAGWRRCRHRTVCCSPCVVRCETACTADAQQGERSDEGAESLVGTAPASPKPLPKQAEALMEDRV